MPVSQDALIHAIETSFFLVPELPGRIEHLRIGGLQGRITPTSHPLANLVGAATLDAATADDTIRQVRDRFASEQKAFGWVVGPSSTPGDLRDRLSAAGLSRVDEMVGMALTDLSVPIRANLAVCIREAAGDDLLQASAMMGRAYGLPADVARLFVEALLLGRGQLRSRTYLASLGEGEPVAFGSLISLPNQPIVLLGGAATMAAHRGQGIYTSLVARRLADARADGAEAAIIQAVRSTSAPICRKLGFTELCGLELFAWTPPTSPPTSLLTGEPPGSGLR